MWRPKITAGNNSAMLMMKRREVALVSFHSMLAEIFCTRELASGVSSITPRLV